MSTLSNNEVLEFLVTKEKTLLTEIRKKERAYHAEIKKLQVELEAIQNAVKGFNLVADKGDSSAAAVAEGEYDANTTWKNKIIYVINDAGHLLNTKEIVDAIVERESDKDREKLSKVISLNLSKMLKDGVIGADQNKGKKGYQYGTTEMFENGSVKEEYKA